ncbi:hypothetical protein FKM82_006448, partial [Ascaphus truei]
MSQDIAQGDSLLGCGSSIAPSGISQSYFLGTAQEELSVVKEVSRFLCICNNYIFQQNEKIKKLEEENKEQKTQIRELLAIQMSLMTKSKELQIALVSKDKAADTLVTKTK